MKYVEINHSLTKQIPEELFEINSLECLQFYCTEISSIPPIIGNLENLKYLNLITNSLEGFPKNVISIPNLVYLDVSNDSHPYPELHCGENKINTIPTEILEMPNLKELRLMGMEPGFFSNVIFMDNVYLDSKRIKFLNYPNVKVYYN